MRKLFYVFLTVFCFYSTSKAQLLNDQEYIAISKQAMNHIYNYEFQKADQLILQLSAKYGKHPVYPFLQAMCLFWKNQPLTKKSPMFENYRQKLTEASDYASLILDKDESSIEANFFQMACYGFLSLHESEDGDMMQALTYGRKAYSYLKKGFNWVDVFPEFYFSSGLYNYYAVQYPATHPIVRPLMSFFEEGNKQTGLYQLSVATQKANFTNVEASIYLADIYMKYEMDYGSAVYHTQQLVNNYPNNPFFWMKHCEALLGNGRYAEATACLPYFSNRSDIIYTTAQSLFKGIIFEKYHENMSDAYTIYNAIIAVEKADRRYTQDYQALAYGGLARIAHWAGKTDVAKDMYRKALKLSEYELLKAEADKYLKSH